MAAEAKDATIATSTANKVPERTPSRYLHHIQSRTNLHPFGVVSTWFVVFKTTCPSSKLHAAIDKVDRMEMGFRLQSSCSTTLSDAATRKTEWNDKEKKKKICA